VKDFLVHLQAKPSAPEMMADLREFYSKKLEETRAAVKRLRALELELSLAMAYLDGCKTCAPLTVKAACHACTEDEHVGQKVPPMVAAVRTEPSP
jgi:recombinational DNA repair protein RecR